MAARIENARTLATLAENPIKELEQFGVIAETHENSYSLERDQIIKGVVALVLSAIVLQYSMKASLPCFAISAALLLSSIKRDRDETEQFKEHKRRINSYFLKLIEELQNVRSEKATFIIKTLSNQIIASPAELKNEINLVAEIYDGTKTLEKYPLNRQMDQTTYTSLLKSARTLMNFNITLSQGSISLIARNQFTILRDQAKRFINGDKRGDQEGQDAYVGYACDSGTALLFRLEDRL